MFINQKIIKFFILLFCFNIFSSISQTNEDVPLNNMAISEIPRSISSVTFQDFTNNEISLGDYKGKLVIINFWATWCAPCKEEMPSLDKLHAKDGIFVFPINLEDKNLKKTNEFFKDLNIINLNTYFDENLKLVKAFSIRGVPTTIIFNKNKDEIARITGGINFSDEKFIYWLESFK